jgi:F-type H+-transporting ATPase subunit epsilon
MAFHVELVSPERILYSGEADMVICRTEGGDIAFLTGHAPFVGALGIGEVRVQQVDDQEIHAAVHGGFVEVRDNRVVILSDVAELAESIDVERAQRALDEAERAGDDPAARRARVRLDVARLRVNS